MSCQACEQVQDDADQRAPHAVAYVRVGNGNVRLTGCREHLAELIRLYRLGLETGG